MSIKPKAYKKTMIFQSDQNDVIYIIYLGLSKHVWFNICDIIPFNPVISCFCDWHEICLWSMRIISGVISCFTYIKTLFFCSVVVSLLLLFRFLLKTQQKIQDENFLVIDCLHCSGIRSSKTWVLFCIKNC